ncbi:hypothetical protein [Brevibacillus laterosporus]|uniref:hypothetical protein n=1 Tax=Brevibacillus laterosporus TaxID=1465 RepID=UPI0018CD1EE0|nr:hypothetical protein [Brevibacillus laterosporus]MBG9789657.1 hypothetical protein [Brevibacillus laterosporus]
MVMIIKNNIMENMLGKINEFTLSSHDLTVIDRIINLSYLETEECLFLKVDDGVKDFGLLTSPANSSSKAELEYNHNELCLNSYFEKKSKFELIKLGIIVLEGWAKRFKKLNNNSKFKLVLTCSDDEASSKIFKELGIEYDDIDDTVLLRMFRVRNDIEQDYFSQEYIDSSKLEGIYVLEV